ncbi:MAG: undecaprenyl-diphosphate phosphatase [Gammaproteobacteria bacterium]|nr:undecaprenyl-diphosphate phosphatase [Gammaproteobacteria bacterium]MCP5424038.1 undecaprenyl-diphosphate phosphatase [Gammaproteobacteria bacterium]MCP5459528.1 undecaprenyl-diphosphate phosphatase [Gammaproteobacteria bacterium]
MDMLQVITLALVQGLTEFLPISSSAHLILVPLLTGWDDQGLAYDVAVHVGTLTAVVVYFRAELWAMLMAWLNSLRTRRMTPDARLAWAVLLGTIPVGLVGLLFKDVIENQLRSMLVIAVATIGFGLLLWWADVRGQRRRDEHTINWKDVLVIGGAQAVALIPGASRSGITMTAGLAMGLTREAAARFSFLLSIPVIVLAGGLETLDLVREPQHAHWGGIVLGTAISAVSAYLCIHYFLKMLERVGMWPFAVYRLVLGIGLLLLVS